VSWRRLISAILGAALVTALAIGSYSCWVGPPGELIATSRSPRGTWEVRAYYNNPGAAASSVVRAEVSGPRGGWREIYLEGDVAEAVISWQSEDVVKVNDKVIVLYR
jgi:hypothetical protein